MGLNIITYALAKKFTKKYVDEVIGDVTRLQFVVVNELPPEGENGKIYLVPNGSTGENTFNEYIWLPDAEDWEMIGSTDIDLSGYVQDSDMIEVSEEDIDDIFDEVFGG